MEEKSSIISNEVSSRGLAEKSKQIADEWEKNAEKNQSSKSVEASSRNIAEKSESDLEDNPAHWENRMNVCLQEKVNELQQIMEVQDKIASMGRNSFEKLREVNDELQEKLQGTEIENENLRRQLKSNVDNIMLLHEDETNRQPDLYQPNPQYTDWIPGWLSNRNGNTFYNTQSIHLYAIFVTTNISLNSWQYAKSWLAAIASFVTIIWQILILYFLILDLESARMPFGTDTSNDTNPCVNFHIDLQFNVIFVLFLFTVILSRDIEETTVEEALLISRTLQVTSQGQSMSMQAQLVSFSLRIQRYTFPWYAGTTIFFALIVESPSVNDTLLNFLAVAFVIALDKMVSVLFLTRDQRASVDQLVCDSQQYGLDLDTPFLFFLSRITSLAATAMIFGLTKALENGLDDKCNFFLSDFLSYLIFTGVLPIFTILIPSLVNIYVDRRDQTCGRTIFRVFGEFIMNACAYCFVILLTLIAMKVSLGNTASSLYSLGSHIEGIWFWIVVALQVGSLILYCIFCWYTSCIPYISITRTPPSAQCSFNERAPPSPTAPPPTSPEYDNIE